MNGNDILRLGYSRGVTVGLALKAAKAAKAQRLSQDAILDELAKVLAAPDDYLSSEIYGSLAEGILDERKQKSFDNVYALDKEAPYRVWGAMGIEPGAIEQLKRAIRLPVAVRGAL